MKNSETIMLCPNCEGKGNHFIHKIEYEHNWYKDEYKKEEICPICNGQGRVIEVITVTYIPYDTKEIKYTNWVRE